MIESKKQMKINNFDKSGLLELLLSTAMWEVLHAVPHAEETASSTATASPIASLVLITPVAQEDDNDNDNGIDDHQI